MVASGASLVDRVVGHLQREIQEGRLRPGERLPSERRLCATFGVSRTTVREALKALMVHGLLIGTPRGAVVAEGAASASGGDLGLARLAARASIRDLYDVRKLLEVQGARWAALHATEADLRRLRRLVAKPWSEGAGDGEVGASPNVDFHVALIAATHNPVLAQIYQSSQDLLFRLSSYWKLMEAGQVEAVRSRRHQLARQWHQAILKAVAARDPDEAAGAMFQHLDQMEKDLLARLPAGRNARRVTPAV